MKILFLVYRDIKNPSSVGGDIYLWELARGLAKHGNDVTIICTQFKGCKTEENINGVKIIRINGALRLPFKIFSKYLHEFKNNVDVVIEEAIGGQRTPYFAGFYIKKPLIAVWHQKHQKIFKEQYSLLIANFLSIFERFLAKIYRNKIIMTPSIGCKELVLTLGFKRDSVKVIYDGVGEKFENANVNRKRENVIVVLGKLRKYKRIDHAIFAVSKAFQKIEPDSKLIIAGKISIIDKNYINKLTNIVKLLKLENKVEIRKNITEQEKIDILESAKILVQPSPIEGFSIVVAEANSCGTPVIASDGVPQDVMINEHNGLVYPFGDLNEFAEAIVKLMKNQKLWEELSKKSYTWSKKFTWKSSTLKLIKILKEIK